jgi:hypothetical protein
MTINERKKIATRKNMKNKIKMKQNQEIRNKK